MFGGVMSDQGLAAMSPIEQMEGLDPKQELHVLSEFMERAEANHRTTPAHTE